MYEKTQKPETINNFNIDLTVQSYLNVNVAIVTTKLSKQEAQGALSRSPDCIGGWQ